MHTTYAPTGGHPEGCIDRARSNMTILADKESRVDSATQPSRTTWQAVQAGLWVGRRGGEFAGMIEQQWGKGYMVTTRLGKCLGTFKTMEEAQSALR